jgi:SNF2 family DNA or RNA helicase
MNYWPETNEFVIPVCEPHISIRLKNIFPKLAKHTSLNYHFKNTPENCTDLIWFMERYPLQLSEGCEDILRTGRGLFHQTIDRLEAIHLPNYKPGTILLKDGYEPRDYQVRGNETYLECKRLLLGDDLGLGKTLTAILSFLSPQTLPGLVVVQTHMPTQWKVEGIEKFTNLSVHIIKGTKPYDLPKADVYIMKYSCLIGWVDILSTGYFKSVVYDECQELRRADSGKYKAARVASENADHCLGLSATPIYNYGDEIFNVLNLINPDCLGSRDDFLREWAVVHGMHYKIQDPKALGTYLREKFLMLRRTRADVGRELPPINKIIHTVGYDENEVKKSEDIARSLAMKVMSGTFEERGQASRELDLLARYTTGISKAKEVAEYVRILLDNDLPVILVGWHRDVYDIWLKELAEYNPVMYTGSETGTQKDQSKQKFINGETKLFIISLRSGAGLDGLQHVCKDVVFGELDWSPKVHDQVIARADRDGQTEQVTAHFLVSDFGSDPVIINLLGLKASQSHGIVDPLKSVEAQYSDESRMKVLAQQYLKGKQLTVFA